MDKQFISRGIPAIQSEDLFETSILNEENRLLLHVIQRLQEEKEARQFERKTEELLCNLAVLAAAIKEKFFRNLNILKYYQKKSRTDRHMCRVSMRIHGQCRQELQKLEEQCRKFKNHLGKTEEELCASSQIYRELITFIKQAQPTLYQWQDITEKLIKDKRRPALRRKYK